MQAVALVSSGLSPEELGALYRRELPFVFGTLRRLGVQPSLLEDYAHDVFAIVFRRYDTYDPTRPLRPWLFGIAYRVVVDARRKLETRRSTTAERDGDLPAHEPSPEERSMHREATERAHAILLAMEVERRAVFILHELEESSMPEIAEALGIPLNTAYSRLRLARRDFNAAAAALKGERP